MSSSASIPVFCTPLRQRLINSLGLFLVFWAANPAHAQHYGDYLPGHAGDVHAVAYSPDGKCAATAGHDGTVILWDIMGERFARASKRHVLKGHDDWVLCVAFSPDSRTVATGGKDRTIRLWDATTGKQDGTLLGSGNWVVGVAFSPSGKTLASVGVERDVRLWEVAGRRERALFRGHTDRVNSVAYSADGKTIATGCFDKTVKLWDVATGRARRTLTGHEEEVYSVALSPDGKTVASASRDNTVRLWDAATGAEKASITIPNRDWAIAAAFSPDGQQVAASTHDGGIRLWNAATGKEVAVVREVPSESYQRQPIWSIAFSPSGETLVSAGRPELRQLANDKAKAPPVNALIAYKNSLRRVAFSGDGQWLAGGSSFTNSKGAALLWKRDTPDQPTVVAEGEEFWSYSVAFSPDSKYLAFAPGSWDLKEAAIVVWDVAAKKTLHTFNISKGSVLALNFSPDGKQLATVGYDGLVHLWDPATGQKVTTLPFKGSISAVAYSPDGKLLAAATGPSIRIWDTASNELRKEIEDKSEINDLAFASDSKVLAAACKNGSVSLWDAASGEAKRSFEVDTEKGVDAVAFAPNEPILAAGSPNRIRLWDIITGKELPAKFTGSADGLAFSADGKTLAATNSEKVIMWDVQSVARPAASTTPVDFPEPGDTSSLPADLVEWTGHRNLEFRSLAAKQLSGYGDAAIPLLVGLLSDENNWVADEAAQSLARIGPSARSALPALLNAYRTGHDWMRYHAIVAIQKIDPTSPEIVPALITLLGDSNYHIRMAAAKDLREFAPHRATEAVTPLIEVLGSEDKYLRSLGAETLGRIGSPAAASALAKLLQDRESFVRNRAAAALGEIGPAAESAVPSLIEALNDSDSTVRLEAIKALGKIGPAARPAVPALIKFTDNTNPDVYTAAQDALQKIAPDELAALRRRPYLIGGGIVGALVLLGVYLVLRRRKKAERPKDKES